MTLPSLAQHIIPSLGGASNVWLFIRTLLDPDAFKLLVLLRLGIPLQIASLHIDTARVSPATAKAAHAVLRADQATRAAQELLQLEQAQDSVQTFEAQRGFAFDLVVRVRIDAFWSGPVPRSLIKVAMRPEPVYVAPRAKAFGGLNDRLGLSGSAVAKLVHRRISAMKSHPEVASDGSARAGRQSSLSESRGIMNSEQLLNWTLGLHGIKSMLVPRMPFCLLARRKCRCCLNVAHCARAGNKCRPCLAEEETAQRQNESLDVPPTWPPNAMARFDAVVPPAYVNARRAVVAYGTAARKADCIRGMQRLAMMADQTSMRAVRIRVPAQEVCRLAGAMNCTFDAGAGKWAGVDCARADVDVP